jgi:hypothetical protein
MKPQGAKPPGNKRQKGNVAPQIEVVRTQEAGKLFRITGGAFIPWQ